MQRFGCFGFRFYGGFSSDVRTPVWRLLFEHEPTIEAFERLAIADACVQSIDLLETLEWRWLGRFASWKFRIEPGAPETHATEALQAIHLAWPLREVVCLTPASSTEFAFEVSASRRVQAQPDEGPGREELARGWWSSDKLRAAVSPDFDKQRTRGDMPRGGWRDVLPAAFAGGDVTLVRLAARPTHDGLGEDGRWAAWEAGHEDRWLTGARASVVIRAAGTLEVVLGDDAIPIESLPGEDAPLRAVALDRAGAFAAYVTEHGRCVWLLEIDETEGWAAAWARDGEIFVDVAWVDDRRLVALSSSEVVLIERRDYSGTVVLARLPLDGGQRMWLHAGLAIVVATNGGCRLVAVGNGLADIAALSLAVRAFVVRDGRTIVDAEDGAHELRRLVSAGERALRERGVYAPAEPVMGSDGDERWFGDGGNALVVRRDAATGAETLARRDGRTLYNAPTGRDFAAWGREDHHYVHDGHRLWDVSDLSIEMCPLSRPLAVAGLYASNTRLLAAAMPDSLRIVRLDDATHTTWLEVAAPPIELLAGLVEWLVIKPRGGTLALLQVRRAALHWVGMWPRALAEPIRAWWYGIHCYVRTRDGRCVRWLHDHGIAHGARVDDLGVMPPDGVPELAPR